MIHAVFPARQVKTSEGKSGRASKRPKMRRFGPSAALAAVTLLWLAESLLAGRSSLAEALGALPHLPLLVLPLGAAVLSRTRAAVVVAAVAAWVVLVPLSGFHLPLAAREAPPGATRIRIITWNTGYGHGGVEPTVREGADVLCLQEISALRLPGLRPPGWSGIVRGEFAILTPHRIVSSRWADLPGPRGALAARLELRGRTLWVVTTHLRPLLYGPWDPARAASLGAELQSGWEQRQAQIAAVATNLRTWGGPVLLAGDLNGRVPGLPLADAFAAGGLGFGYTAPAAVPLLRLDRVLVSEEFGVSGARTLGAGESDHLPVAADVWLP